MPAPWIGAPLQSRSSGRASYREDVGAEQGNYLICGLSSDLIWGSLLAICDWLFLSFIFLDLSALILAWAFGLLT